MHPTEADPPHLTPSTPDAPAATPLIAGPGSKSPCWSALPWPALLPGHCLFQAPLHSQILQSPAQRPPLQHWWTCWLPGSHTALSPACTPEHVLSVCEPLGEGTGSSFPCSGRGRIGCLRIPQLVAGPGRVPGRVEAGAGPSWAAADTQTRGTSHHKSRPGDFWAGSCGCWEGGPRGGWDDAESKGRMQASP